MASAEPILLSGVWLDFKKEPVRVHDIVREIVQVSKDSCGKKVRLAFFYQNDSFDAVIPYGLEMLYQLRDLYHGTEAPERSKKARGKSRPEPRDKILVYGGKIYQYLKASYKDSYFGTGNFCNDLFGLGVISQNGHIKGEKKIYPYGHRSKKAARDKFLLSSRYTLFPSSEIASSIAAVVIVAPALSALHRVAQICAWCDANDIPTITLFDPYPTIRKLRFYESQNFIVYGWSLEDMKSAALNCHFTQQTPLSDSKRLADLSNLLTPEIVSVNGFDACSLLDAAHSLMSDIRQKTDRDAFSRGAADEAQSVLRRLSTLSVPLDEYDREYSGLYFQEPLSGRVNNLKKIVETSKGGYGILADMVEVCQLLSEITTELAASNPKFNELAVQVNELIANEKTGLILVPGSKEVRALMRSFGKMSVPLGEQELADCDIKISSFDAPLWELEDAGYDVALLSTYPYYNQKYLLAKSLANTIKITLYPSEAREYDLFSELYRQVEKAFFTSERRAEIRHFLSGESDLKIARIGRVDTTEDTPVILTHATSVLRRKDILSSLDFMERMADTSAQPLFQQFMLNRAIQRTKGGEVTTSGLLIQFQTGVSIIVKEDKLLQISPASGEMEFKLAKHLRVGEVVVLVNRDTRLSLNDLILEKIAGNPTLELLRAMVGLWVDTLKQGMTATGDNPVSLLRKLQESGSQISSAQTVKSWVSGEVIGPQDPFNVVRIATIYANDDLAGNASNVVQAITMMRGIRRRILLRAKNALLEGEGEELEKLGIDLDDFADALEFFVVTSIQQVDNVSLEKVGKIGWEYEI